MNLEEAILYELNRAQEESNLFTLCPYPSEMCDGRSKKCKSSPSVEGCLILKDKHLQYAEWLRELSDYRSKENAKSSEI